MTELFARSFRDLDQPEIPGYRVREILGQGGHAIVYRAADESGREVAIKRWLDPELEDKARSHREAEALAELDHPRIAAFIAQTQDHSGRPCLVMEHIDGRALNAVLEERGPLSPQEVIELGLALAEVLEYLAERGIVHRDIKPSNVILRDGAPVLVDFSIVKRPSLAREGELTATGSSIGTASYMAPEQCEGELGERASIDHRTDIYGLGALLFHALTGHPPWRRETAWERLTRDPWRQPYPTRPKIRQEIQAAQRAAPPELGKIIARCLQGKPRRRYAHPRQPGRALNKLRTRLASPRRSAAKPLLMGLAAVLVLVFGLFSFFFDRAPASAPTEKRSQEPQERDPNMTSQTTRLAAFAAPLILIAAGSPLEAQSYESVQDARGKTRKAVRAPAEFFPLEGPARRYHVHYGAPPAKRGRLIVSIIKGKPAYKAGLRVGDTLRSVNSFKAERGYRGLVLEPSNRKHRAVIKLEKLIPEIPAIKDAAFWASIGITIKADASLEVEKSSAAERAGLRSGDQLGAQRAIDPSSKPARVEIEYLQAGSRDPRRAIIPIKSSLPTADLSDPRALIPLGLLLAAPEKQDEAYRVSASEPVAIQGRDYRLQTVQRGEDRSRSRYLRRDSKGIFGRADRSAEERLAIPFPLIKGQPWSSPFAPLPQLGDRPEAAYTLAVEGFSKTEGFAAPSLTLSARWTDDAGKPCTAQLQYQRGQGLVKATILSGDRLLFVERAAESKGSPAQHKAPTAITAAARDGSITLTWRPNPDNALILVERYEVLRRSKGEGFKRLASVKGNAFQYRDREVERGVAYTYKIRSIARLNELDPVIARLKTAPLTEEERVQDSAESATVSLP